MADGKEPPLADIVVGDRFWLAYAQQAVQGAVKSPEARATQLAATIAWFWTVYSAAGVLAIAFGAERLGGWMAALVGVPSGLLVIAYWQATTVGRPLLFQFDPRVPAEIEAAYVEAAARKQRALHRAEIWAAVAAAAVVLGLAAAFASPPVGKSTLAARFDPTDATRLLVVAELPGGTAVTFSAVAASAPAGAPPASSAVLARADGAGSASARLPATPGPQRVTASWTDEKDRISRAMSVEVVR